MASLGLRRAVSGLWLGLRGASVSILGRNGSQPGSCNPSRRVCWLCDLHQRLES